MMFISKLRRTRNVMRRYDHLPGLVAMGRLERVGFAIIFLGTWVVDVAQRKSGWKS